MAEAKPRARPPSPVMMTSSPSSRNFLVCPFPSSTALVPLHDSSNRDPKLSGSFMTGKGRECHMDLPVADGSARQGPGAPSRDGGACRPQKPCLHRPPEKLPRGSAPCPARLVHGAGCRTPARFGGCGAHPCQSPPPRNKRLWLGPRRGVTGTYTPESPRHKAARLPWLTVARGRGGTPAAGRLVLGGRRVSWCQPLALAFPACPHIAAAPLHGCVLRLVF